VAGVWPGAGSSRTCGAMSAPPARVQVVPGGVGPLLAVADAGVPDGGNAGRCSAYAAEHIGVILDQAAARGERVPDTETVVDRVVAPLMYRILFRPDGLDTAHARGLVASLLTPAPR
ncbi:TetR-like C-terminal domain-containing protein, partial [Streptomyces toxytricini]|uniref:TetR-like C-terminal domain-containing protein n=1 Tax=Streptomyces toxytricini TaxID=67369 RepID=UPI003431ADA5